jgi:hypothetical protein
MDNIDTTEQVIDLLARPCKRCGFDLFFEHGLRKYCVGCNPQDNASRDIRTEAQRAEDERLEQVSIDHWLRHFNKDRAFSTFGTHNPIDELPSFSVKRRKDRRREHVGHDVHVKPIEPKSNADRDVLRDLDWAERQQKLSKSTKGPIKKHAKRVRRITDRLPRTIGDGFRTLPGKVSDQPSTPLTPPVQRGLIDFAEARKLEKKKLYIVR